MRSKLLCQSAHNYVHLAPALKFCLPGREGGGGGGGLQKWDLRLELNLPWLSRTKEMYHLALSPGRLLFRFHDWTFARFKGKVRYAVTKAEPKIA